MKILVTGSTGVIGRQVVEDLLKKGHQVTGVIRSNGGGYPKAINFRPAFGNLLDANFVTEIVDGQDAIIHLAHDIGDGAEWSKNKDKTSPHQDSILMARNLLYAASDDTRFVFASSVSVYGKQPYGKYITEDAELAGKTAYAHAKIAIEDMIQQLHPNHVIFRLTRVAAPWGKNSISNVVRAVKDGTPFTLYNNGNTVIDTIHVLDVSDAMHRAATGTGLGVYNLANSDPRSMERILHDARLYLRKKVDQIRFVPENPTNDPIWAVHDESKFFETFGIPTRLTRNNIYSLCDN